jgi:predicted DNA-binding transcriptional regulator
MLRRTDALGQEYRSMLNQYCKCQRENGVDIYMLPDDKLPQMQLSEIERGWMLVDQRDPLRVAGIYGILKEGVVKEGAVLFGESPETIRLADEFGRLLAAAMLDRTIPELLIEN